MSETARLTLEEDAARNGTPFASAAADYLGKGFWPIPVFDTDKAGIPRGVTGHQGRGVTGADVAHWSLQFPRANIALRLTEDLVALDVDDYDGKPGRATFEQLKAEYGPLPPTVVATARDLPSGKYLYRIPVGVRLKGTLGPGMEVIQFHHRYVVCWPSVHASGRTVGWVDELSGEERAIPEIDDIPELPWAWIDGLSVVAGASCPAAGDDQVEKWRRDFTLCTAPRWLAHLLTVTGSAMADGTSRHDTMLKRLCQAVREAAAGAYQAIEVEDGLRSLWAEAMNTSASRADRERGPEFDSMLAWAVGQMSSAGAAQEIAAIAARLPAPAATPPVVHGTPAAPGPLPEPDAFTDALYAEALGEHLRGSFLYCEARGGWLIWDGVRWRPDSNEQVFEAARRYAVDLTIQVKNGTDPDRTNGSGRYQTRAKIDAVVTLARRLDGIVAEASEFDVDPNLLCCTNGVVDLRTGEIQPHDPALRITKTADVEYDPDATHPDVNSALEAMDPEVREYMQVALGYSATGHVSEDLLLVLDGSGSNGKTTLLGAVSAALGEYAAAAPQKLLMKSGSDEHPTLLARLNGQRFVTVEETPEGGALRVETMKALTGGSRISARYMYRDYFDFAPTHQIIIATNHRPAVNATDHATWRRLRLIPFPHRYAVEPGHHSATRRADPGLRSRLQLPPQRTAMLAWLIAGARRWYADGLPACPTVTEATSEWQQSEDIVVRFSDAYLTFDPTGSMTATEMYLAYQRFCEHEGRPAQSLKEFNKKVDSHDLFQRHCVTRTRTKRGQVWMGVTLGTAPATRAGSVEGGW